jgi:acyl-CoA thioesterase FadM
MRLTLDYDKIGRNKLRRRIKRIQSLFLRNPIEVFKTKHGYHIIVYNVNANTKEILYLRGLLCDDKVRIFMDTMKLKRKSITPQQVLWTNKGGFTPLNVTANFIK